MRLPRPHRRPRGFAGEEWALRDARRAGLLFLLLLLSIYHPFFLVLAVAWGTTLVVQLGVRHLRKRRRERANQDAPFWADRLR